MRLFCFIFALNCIFTMTVYSDTSVDAKFSDQAAKTANRLRESIGDELKTLSEHPWAGEYYQGDGLGVNISLMLAPKKGCLFEWHGCLGLYDRNYGAVVFQENKLHLSLTLTNKREGFHGIAEDFTPIPWSGRKYLIPTDDVIGFCNKVNDGSEPRAGVHGNYLLRAGDEAKKVSGFPGVPAKFKSYLLTDPISAEITEIGITTTRPSLADFQFKDTTVLLNAGKEQGILPGMVLYVIEPTDIVESVKILKVEGGKSKGEVTQIDEEEDGPRIGWKLSTRPRWYIERPTNIQTQ